MKPCLSDSLCIRATACRRWKGCPKTACIFQWAQIKVGTYGNSINDIHTIRLLYTVQYNIPNGAENFIGNFDLAIEIIDINRVFLCGYP